MAKWPSRFTASVSLWSKLQRTTTTCGVRCFSYLSAEHCTSNAPPINIDAYKVMMSEDSDWMKMMAEFDGNMENRTCTILPYISKVYTFTAGLEFVKIHLCMLAATRLRSKYLDVEHARFWISRPCQFEGFIRHVWKIVERFMRVDAWIQYVFDDLHNIVMECGGHYLTDLKVKALAEIAKGSAAVTEMRTTSSDALYWLRTRYPPRKQRNA